MSRDIRENEFCGVTKFHDDGYMGQGVGIWNMENLGGDDHGYWTEQRIIEAAPKAQIITHGCGGYSDKDKYQATVYFAETGKTITAEEFIEKNNIKIITRSAIDKQGSFVFEEGAKKEYWKATQKKYNLILVAAGGNGCSKYNFDNPQGSDIAMLIGSCKLTKSPTMIVDNGDVSANDDIDFTDFKGESGGQSGTSFAAPYFAGKCALICEKFGMDITHDEMYQIMVNCASGNGKWIDKELGYGLPRIQFAEREGNNMVIEMQVGNNVMTVDGVAYDLDQPPVINPETSRTLVPIRAIAEAFGCDVAWDKKTQKITITKGETV